jgi:hypothetical protein
LRPVPERVRPLAERPPLDALRERLPLELERPLEDRPEEEREPELAAFVVRDCDERPRVEPVRVPELDRLRPLSLSPSPLSSSCCSSDSSSPPISFFATPTAAGSTTPIAAPAAIFWPVDMPSSSEPLSSSLATSTSRGRGTGVSFRPGFAT